MTFLPDGIASDRQDTGNSPENAARRIPCGETRLPLLFAHRGASHDMPENTLAAFHVGWEQQADGVEVDVHLTKDDEIVVIHDGDTQRTTGMRGKVREATFLELQKLDAGSWKAVLPEVQRIPSLSEVLDTGSKDGLFLVEIKCGAEILPALKRTLQHVDRSNRRLQFQSFHFDTIVSLKRAFPTFPAFWLVDDTKADLSALLDKAHSAGLDGVNPYWNFPVTPEVTQKAHQLELKVYVWTVDSPEAARKVAADGVDGIITNRPALIRDALAAGS